MQEPLLDVEQILRALSDAGVRYVLIGGIAVNVHGSARLTRDLDIVYDREEGNLRAIVSALKPLHPRLRIKGGSVPFLWDERTLRSGFHFTLNTDAGPLDLLGDAPGVGSFQTLWDHADETDLYEAVVKVASLEDMLAMKRASNRLTDQEDIMELERLLKLAAQEG